ncbi:VgrG-related protein [Streptomyces chrestomyceticus]|uniref:VgrG-related protein n=1 Tax=Streptomyces chrestomyceticus TaxID=68185 RepID=UPI0019CF4DD5|nr:VgrG-related protein [Streptomyces chrestomyceticus]
MTTGELLVEIGGRLLPDTARRTLEHAQAQTSTALPPLAWLRFREPDPDLLRAAGIGFGSEVALSVVTAADTGPLPLFHGEVTAIQSEVDGTGSHLVVTARHRAYRMRRDRTVAAHAGITLRDVVERLASRAGLRVGEVDGGDRRYPHLTQPGTSDWAFLEALAREEGARLGIDPDGRLSVRRPASVTGVTHTVRNGVEKVASVRAAVDGTGQYGTVHVRGWDQGGKKALHASAAAHDSGRLALGLAPGQAADTLRAAPLTATACGASGQSDVQYEAEALAASVADGFAELEVVTELTPRLRAGQPVGLAGFGWPFDGRYTPTEVDHVLAETGYQTRLWFAAVAEPDGTGREQAGAVPDSTGRMAGLAIGLVTNVHHTSAPDRGWVKLQFPWLSGEYESDWVRTAQPGGKGGGGLLLPDVGDEVLVGFERGRLDRPYVIGGLYNGVDRPSAADDGPPVADDGAVCRRWIANREGDRLELPSARGGPSGVQLETGDKKLRLRLDRQNSEVTVHAGDGADPVITVGTDGTVVVNARDAITLRGEGLTLDAGTGRLDLSASAVTIKANTVDIQGP